MSRIFSNPAGRGSIATSSSTANSFVCTEHGIMDTDWEREYYLNGARLLGVLTTLAFLDQVVDYVDRLRHIPTLIMAAPNSVG